MTRKCTCKLPSGHGHTAECEMLFPQPILTDGQRWFQEKQELQERLAALKKGLYIAHSALIKINDAEEDIAAECLSQNETDKSRHLRLLQKHFEAIEEALGEELYDQVKQGRL